MRETARAIMTFLGAATLGLAVVSLTELGARSPAPGKRNDASRSAPGGMEQARREFARPTHLPAPASNPQSREKISLGERLFNDRSLSSNGKVACATCHDPQLAFTDGEPLGKGVTGNPLKRHAPALWNLAWAPLLFWDGRAGSLEDQARGPIEHPDEMGERLDSVLARLSQSIDYKSAFALAFPENPAISAHTLTHAIAAYERTLVSPPTAFDRWLAGDAAALAPAQVRGFTLFTGKAGCSACHSGFSFTDHGFYDIGLPGNDPGRGPILGVPAANAAFKTPTLRELVWTAPYMHDGSLATLEDVVRHYETGGIHRPTRAKELGSGLGLTNGERADLIAFLESLSSRQPPRPSSETWIAGAPPAAAPSTAARVATTVSQVGKQFSPTSIRLSRSQALTVLNDDSRTHNVRIYDPRLDFNSGAQEPGDSISIRFPEAGLYGAFCGIHPAMRLTIQVDDK